MRFKIYEISFGDDGGVHIIETECPKHEVVYYLKQFIKKNGEYDPTGFLKWFEGHVGYTAFTFKPDHRLHI